MTPLESSDPRAIPPFDIRGRLGAGGMGVVYAALSPENHWVAVKVIRPEFATDQDFRERFTREVQLMSRIRARCISSVLAYDTSTDQPWFATAFLPGPTLNERVRQQGALPEAKARVLAVGMAEAIAAIHASGVVHRDLKPSNVILAPDGPKVLDFGIARALDGTQLTRTGGLVGSPGWMSPERFRGGAGPEADVFSWGALVAYAVTGRPPFGTGSAEELMFRLLSGEPDLSGVPESLREVVTRALAKEPQDRPTAAELVRSLAAEEGEESAPVSPDEMATLVGALIDQDWSGASGPFGASGPSGASGPAWSSAPSEPSTPTPPPSGSRSPQPSDPQAAHASGAQTPAPQSPPPSPASTPSGPHTSTPSGPHAPTPSGPHTAATSGPHTSVPSGSNALPPQPPGGAAAPSGPSGPPFPPRQAPSQGQSQGRPPQGQPQGQPGQPPHGPTPAPFPHRPQGQPSAQFPQQSSGPAPHPAPGTGPGPGTSPGTGAGTRPGTTPPPGFPPPHGASLSSHAQAFTANPALAAAPSAPRSTASRSLWRFLVAAAAVLLVVGGGTGWFLLRDGAAGSDGDQRGEDGSGTGETQIADAAADQSEPFVFGTPGQVQTLDPFLAADGDTHRYSRQVFETLLRHDPADGQIVGGLAESWEHSEDGTEWTFQLREGVRFHDGDELSAEAVCANFDRWNNLTGEYQNAQYTYYWQFAFGGFAENEDDYPDLTDSNYVSCTAVDALTSVITLDESSSKFPGAFTLASFGILSPSTVAEIADAPFLITAPAYATDTEALAGTGPFSVVEWDQNQNELTLGRFDDYWDDSPEIQAGVRTVVLRTIADRDARRPALESGDVHGYETVLPEDVVPLQEAGFRVPERVPFNVLYLGYQQEANDALQEQDVRDALAHAVDRQRILDEFQPPGSTLANQFVPEGVNGWSPNVREIEHSPEVAEELLAEAGHEDLTIEFCYPSDGPRAYLNDPVGVSESISADLEAVGVTVEPVPGEWIDFVTKVTSGECPLYLLGWHGDYNDASNFIDPQFSGKNDQFGFEDDALFDAAAEAAAVPDTAERVAAYEDLNVEIMEFLPGLPISSSPSGIVFSDDVEPPAVGPLPGHENFAETFWK